MQESMLLSSGEFAQMCNVSRELLIHYDKIGLLKPKEVTENGYRYYSLRQLYLFDVIRFFMDTGMSMKEIKDYLENRTTDLFLSTAQTSIESMKKQRDLLDARIGMMEKMRYITQRAILFPKEKPRLSYWDDVWFISTALEDSKKERTQQVYAKAVSEHSDYCRNVAGVSRFPLGRIVSIPDPQQPEVFYYENLVTWISPPANPNLVNERLICKPKGNYAVILHQGGTSTVDASYRKLFSYIRKEGLEMLSPVYELDMHSYLMSESTEDYLVHISVLVDA